MFQRKGYDRDTKQQWAARLLVEADEDNNEERSTDDDDDESGSDDENLLKTIEKYSYCLTVLERDIQEIQAKFDKDMEVMKRMTNFPSHISDDVVAAAVIATNVKECMQDNAAMTNRMISLRTDLMKHELGMRKIWYADKKETHKALCCNYVRRQEMTAKGGCGNDGKRFTVLVPTHKRLAARTSTPPAPHDEHE